MTTGDMYLKLEHMIHALNVLDDSRKYSFSVYSSAINYEVRILFNGNEIIRKEEFFIELSRQEQEYIVLHLYKNLFINLAINGLDHLTNGKTI